MTNPLLSCPGSESPSSPYQYVHEDTSRTSSSVAEGQYNYIGNGLLHLFALLPVSLVAKGADSGSAGLF